MLNENTADVTEVKSAPEVSPDTQAATPETTVTEAPEAKAEGAAAPEAKAEEAKDEGSLLSDKEEAAENKDPVPENYEFKVPEGTELDAAMVDAFKPLAKELGLGNAAAQKLVDLVATHTQKAVDAQREQEVKMVSDWKQQILADPGHRDLIANAKLTVQKFGADNPEFKQLTDSWLGSHPGFVKFLARIGTHLKEAEMTPGTVGTGGNESLGSILYPSMKKK